MMTQRMGMRRLSANFLFILFFATGSFAQITPTKLADVPAGLSADPGVVINIKDPKNIVVSIAPDRILYSVDGGAAWKESKVSSRVGVRGGMKLISELKGGIDLIHYCDPSNPSRTNDRFALQSSDDKGATWKEEAVFGNPVSKDDKETRDQTNPSLAIHPKKRILYGVWTQSDKLGLNDPNCHSNILFGSWNGGKQWAKPVQINQNPGDCSGQEGSAGGATIVMDLNEHLYAAWSNQGMIYFDRSYDGEVWLSRDLAIGHPESMFLNIPGFGAIASRPTLAVDLTPTKFHGSLYIVYTEGKKGSIDANVALLRSTNHGDNFVGPTRFRKDEIMGQQFAPSIALDNTT
ncbi:MAG TPA: sialidase family protein, partial [Cyclobacteriaceae bacterium]|nr:sialidase family protein [Cyclobacteriaceae bacterium]